MFWEFDYVGNFKFKEGFAAVQKDGKFGYINTKGEQIVECKFDYAHNFHEGFARVLKDGKYGCINTKGVECKFNEVRDFKEGFAAVEKDGKWGYINTKGEQIVECKFDDTSYFYEGFARVKKDGKWGYINTKGEQIIECKFDDVGYFNEGFAPVQKDGKYGYINTKGYSVIFDKSKNEIMEVFDKVIDRSNNTFYLSRLGDKFGLLDENFSVVIKNSIYGKFEVLQRINETTFLIKIAERDLFVDSEGNFR